MPNAFQDDDQPAQSPRAAADNDTADRRGILIVEDNRSIATAMAKVLERGGYRPTVWNSGGEALNWVQSLNGSRNTLQAAIIDIHLPDLHGLILSSKLRALLGPSLPIIVVSGDTSMENLNALPHVGATYFLPKPVNAATLLERLRDSLAKNSGKS
jgi:DNA-binding response OmpR family regulator